MSEPIKILLVEDNPDNRDMLSRRLTRKGYNVVMAVDGQEAIDKTHAERPADRSDGYEPAGHRRLGRRPRD